MERSFRDRLSAIEARNAALAGQPRNEITQDYRSRVIERDVSHPNFGDAVRTIFAIPVGLLLGASAVLAGQVIEFRFIVEPGMAMGTDRFGPAFVIALALSFVADRVLRGGILGQGAITAGFVAMIWFEIELAKMFPALWGQLYDDPEMIAAWIATYG